MDIAALTAVMNVTEFTLARAAARLMHARGFHRGRDLVAAIDAAAKARHHATRTTANPRVDTIFVSHSIRVMQNLTLTGVSKRPVVRADRWHAGPLASGNA